MGWLKEDEVVKTYSFWSCQDKSWMKNQIVKLKRNFEETLTQKYGTRFQL